MNEQICIREVNENLRLIKLGEPLTRPLKELNCNCEFKKRYNEWCNIQDGLEPETDIKKVEAKAKQREYYRTHPEYKAKMREYYRTHPEYKAKKREYQSTPEYKAKQREYYRTHPEYKAKQREYYRTHPEYKAKMREYYRRKLKIPKSRWRKK
jgi:hypothetical protein